MYVPVSANVLGKNSILSYNLFHYTSLRISRKCRKCRYPLYWFYMTGVGKDLDEDRPVRWLKQFIIIKFVLCL